MHCEYDLMHVYSGKKCRSRVSLQRRQPFGMSVEPIPRHTNRSSRLVGEIRGLHAHQAFFPQSCTKPGPGLPARSCCQHGCILPVPTSLLYSVLRVLQPIACNYSKPASGASGIPAETCSAAPEQIRWTSLLNPKPYYQP